MTSSIANTIESYKRHRRQDDEALLSYLGKMGFGYNDIVQASGGHYFITRICLKGGRPWWYGHKFLKNRQRGKHEHSIGDFSMIRKAP
jgi:hypothetical protein